MNKIPEIVKLFVIIVTSIFIIIGMILIGWIAFDAFGAFGFFVYTALLFNYGSLVLSMIINCE